VKIALITPEHEIWLILPARSGWEKERKQELVNNLEPWVRFGGKRFVRYDGIIDSKIVFPTLLRI